MTIGELIKIRRKELGMTQDELARLTGYSGKGAITKIETGVNDLNQTKIKIFAQALRCSPLYLLNLDDSPVSEPQCILSADESALLDDYQRLNPKGKEEASRHMKYLASQEEYTKDTGSLNAADGLSV